MPFVTNLSNKLRTIDRRPSCLFVDDVSVRAIKMYYNMIAYLRRIFFMRDFRFEESAVIVSGLM